MKKQFLSFLLILIIPFNTKAQKKIFDDGKVQIFETRADLEYKICGSENWRYVKIELTVINNSGNPIIIDKLSANFTTRLSSPGNYTGGSFYPCDKPFGWTSKGNNFIAVFNQNLKNGQQYIHPMYAWAWETLENVTMMFDIAYTGRGTSSNNQQNSNVVNQNTKPTKPTNASPQSIKTKYTIENNQLVIDNGDTRESIPIWKMTQSEISFYENLSGLKLKTTTNNNTENKSPNSQSATIQSENANNQQRIQQQRQQDYATFQQQQQERQQREFNEHIQRQMASNERFSNNLDMAGNLMLSIISAGRDKKKGLAGNFALGFIEDMNATKSNIQYYKHLDKYSEYPKIEYVIDENYLTNSSRDENSAIIEFISYLTQDKNKYKSEETGYTHITDNNSHLLLTTKLYSGRIDIHSTNHFVLNCYQNQYILLSQFTSFGFHRPNGNYESEMSVFGVKQAIGEMSVSNTILFSIFDIMSFENVGGKTENLPDGSNIYYPRSFDEISNFKNKTRTFSDGSSTADIFNLVKVQLSTGEFFLISTKGNADTFIDNANSLLEKSKKEWFFLQQAGGGENSQVEKAFSNISSDNSTNMATGQRKISYINMDEVINNMPEAARVDAELREYEQALHQLYQDMQKEADSKSAQFVKDSLKMTPTMRELKRNEIVEIYNKLENWNQTAQDMYNQKSQEIVGPLFKKAFDIVNTTAKENGYTYVIDSSNSEMVLFPPSDMFPSGDDLMPMVKIKLGVKYTPIKSAKKQVTGISYQLKLGYINMSELTSVMPEAARIDAELKEYEQSLGQLYQDMLKEAENKSALFVKDSLRMTPTMRELKRNEIVELNNKLQNWSKTAQDIYNQKSQEKLGPIFKKALEVVNTTAKEAGYTHVLDSSNNGMVKAPPENDLLPLVKSKLGIK